MKEWRRLFSETDSATVDGWHHFILQNKLLVVWRLRWSVCELEKGASFSAIMEPDSNCPWGQFGKTEPKFQKNQVSGLVRAVKWTMDLGCTKWFKCCFAECVCVCVCVCVRVHACDARALRSHSMEAHEWFNSTPCWVKCVRCWLVS